MQDIFIPESSPDAALVGPLHTVTYVTSEPQRTELIFTEGYGLTSSGWSEPELELAQYLGFDANHAISACSFYKSGEGANVQVRVVHVDPPTPQVRPDWMGLYEGGATISCPINDLYAHEKHMAKLGVDTTIGVKEMDFTSPTGETYTSAEIVYKAPENVFVMGVTRPDIFVPTGPIDPATGMGGPSYSARCITQSDTTMQFFRDVLGWEIRRDVEFTVGERSALQMPEGTVERFIQGFAPGARTGYVVLMDHGDATKPKSAPGFGPPYRGITMWSFLTKDIDTVAERAANSGITVLQPIADRTSLALPAGRTLILQDPDGFPIEIVEAA